MVFISRILFSILVFNISPSIGISQYSTIKPSKLRNASDSEVQSENLGSEITKILDKMIKNYDKRIRPNYGGKPEAVAVTMYVQSISTLSEVDMDFTMDFFFRQQWNDQRLKFKGPPGVPKIVLKSEFGESLWMPDTFFVNAKNSNFHEATTPNEFIIISENGDVLKSSRYTVTASCPMDLHNFPMDHQYCSIKVESYAYTIIDINYTWANGTEALGVASDISLPQFTVIGFKQKDSKSKYFSGTFSQLQCQILFGREMGYYLIQIYIPSALNVIISWISFWLNRNSTSARVAIGVTTVLTMATLMSSTNSSLPKISYIKAIDVYLVACFVMVFASLLQNAILGYLKKRIQIRKNNYLARKLKLPQKANKAYIPADDEDIDEIDDDADIVNTQVSEISNTRLDKGDTAAGNKVNRVILCIDSENSTIYPDLVEKIFGLTPFDVDKYSREFFPLAFIIFNVAYWIVYLHISDAVENDLVFL